MQGYVFDYKRVDAIKQQQDITDALFDVLTTRIHAGSQWTVKVIAKNESPQQKHTRKQCRTIRK